MKSLCVFKYLYLILTIPVSGCLTQTINLNDKPKLPSGQMATLSFPLSVRVKIDGKDVEFKRGVFATGKQIKLPPDTYNIQWERSGTNYTFVYKGSGTLKVEPGQKYEIKFDKQLGYTSLAGTSVSYKYTKSVVLDYATWIENTNTKEILVGRKLQNLSPKTMNYVTTLYKLAEFSNDKGDYKSVIEFYRQALELKPDSFIALNGLAWTLATCKDESFRDPVLAVEYAKKACELSYYSVPSILDTLATAYAANGNFIEAQGTARKALDIAKTRNNQEELKMLQNHLELFESGRPYIEDG